MGHVARDVVFRARDGGRHGRTRWLLAITALNLMLWSVLIVLIARAAT